MRECLVCKRLFSHSFLVVFDGDLLEAVHPPLNLPRERRFTVYWYARFSCSVHTAQSFQTRTDMSWISSDVLFQLCFMITTLLPGTPGSSTLSVRQERLPCVDLKCSSLGISCSMVRGGVQHVFGEVCASEGVVSISLSDATFLR